MNNSGRIPFTCSRTVYYVLEHCSEKLERNISAQFYCSVLNGVFSEHCLIIRTKVMLVIQLAIALHLDLFRTARTCSEEHGTLFRNIPLI